MKEYKISVAHTIVVDFRLEVYVYFSIEKVLKSANHSPISISTISSKDFISTFDSSSSYSSYYSTFY